jgi:hypothetical protein
VRRQQLQKEINMTCSECSDPDLSKSYAMKLEEFFAGWDSEAWVYFDPQGGVQMDGNFELSDLLQIVATLRLNEKPHG